LLHFSCGSRRLGSPWFAGTVSIDDNAALEKAAGIAEAASQASRSSAGAEGGLNGRTLESGICIMMNIHEILKRLPHRYPFLLVDRVLELETGKRIKALKNVSINEPFFVGHFPQRPVMPGVLMLEAMAQTAALMAFDALGVLPDDQTIFYFAGIDGARFKRPVEPGDQLVLEAELDRMKAGIYKFKARAKVGDELACEAELICTIRRVV
jgi:3-hydroxyacyl-[acyl-carrier-protein] dehydratase